MHWEFRGQVQSSPMAGQGAGDSAQGVLQRCSQTGDCPVLGGRLNPPSLFPLLQISPTKSIPHP